MERIWSPWRNAYVTTAGKQPEGCVMCLALAAADAEDSLVVHRAAHNFVVMNLYPYGSGHLMVAPRRHVGSLAAATADELQEMILLAQKVEAVFAAVYRPDGMNIGMNLGKSAGAGVADHIHLHAVPRWAGDTNFMTVVGETRVIPENPFEACRRLREHFK